MKYNAPAKTPIIDNTAKRLNTNAIALKINVTSLSLIITISTINVKLLYNFLIYIATAK